MTSVLVRLSKSVGKRFSIGHLPKINPRVLEDQIPPLQERNNQDNSYDEEPALQRAKRTITAIERYLGFHSTGGEEVRPESGPIRSEHAMSVRNEAIKEYYRSLTSSQGSINDNYGLRHHGSALNLSRIQHHDGRKEENDRILMSPNLDIPMGHGFVQRDQ